MYKNEPLQKMKALVALLLASTATLAMGQGIPRPAFGNDRENFTQSGYIKLSWQWEAPGVEASPVFRLQRSREVGFAGAATIYEGPDLASFRSGLGNGLYYYRVQAVLPGEVASEWSEPVLVKVKHHSLALTFTLAGLGAAVFLLTAGVVVQGARRTRTTGAL